MFPLKDENPTIHFPFITVLLIGTNIFIFISLIGDARSYDLTLNRYGLIPFEFAHSPIAAVPTLFSAMFLHAGWGHLLGNMLYLWIFGNNIEDVLGKFRFVLFYFLCGALASFCHIATEGASRVPMVGASGAISGILGAYLVLYPRARVLTLIFLGFYITLIRIPALILLSLWMIIQIVSSIFGGDGSGIAWYAHIGGFLAGIILIQPFRYILGSRIAP
ncbi:MAG: rhomboid family intramembrane serine protease [Nitrospinales bacterium]